MNAFLPFSTAQLADALGVTARAIRQRALREGWVMAARDGRTRLYAVEQLPADVRAEIETRRAGFDAAKAAALPGIVEPKSEAPHLTPAAVELCQLRASLVHLFRQARGRARSGRKLGKAERGFVQAYCLGQTGPFAELFARLGEVSVDTLRRWDRVLRGTGGDVLSLMDRRGHHRRGGNSITDQQAKILVNLALSPNCLPMSEIIRSSRAFFDVQGIAHPQDDRTFRRFLEGFKNDHFDRWVFFRHGEKALNDLCVPHLTRDGGRLAVGDVLVADGHVLNWQAIDPTNGKPRRFTLVAWMDFRSGYICGFDLSAAENTSAIALSLQRAIFRLGKLPRVVILDNGRAFRAKFFNQIADFRQTALPGAFEALGISVNFAKPYHAESKPVERFFGIFAELERRAPTFVGTGIDDKPPRMKRNEKIHKRLHDRLTGGRVPTLIESFRAVADWLDHDYHPRPAQSGQRQGVSPQELFESGCGPGFDPADVSRIRTHLSPALTRRVFRDGVRVPGEPGFYYHPALYGRQQQNVVVRFDWAERDRIWVYNEDGQFLCTAERRALVHPAARVLGTDEEKEELRRQLALAGSLKKQTLSPIRQLVETEVLPVVLARQTAAGFECGEIPGSPPRKLLPFTPAGDSEEEVEPMSDEKWAAVQAEAAEKRKWVEAMFTKSTSATSEDEGVWELVPVCEQTGEKEAIWDVLPTLPDDERYQRGIDLEVRGLLLPESERAWRSYYEATEGYERLRDYFSGYRVKATHTLLWEREGEL